MGLGFNGHYIQQYHNFRNKLHCYVPYDSSETSHDMYNKNIKLCLFDEHVFQYIIQMLSKHLSLWVAALLSF